MATVLRGQIQWLRHRHRQILKIASLAISIAGPPPLANTLGAQRFLAAHVALEARTEEPVITPEQKSATIMGARHA